MEVPLPAMRGVFMGRQPVMVGERSAGEPSSMARPQPMWAARRFTLGRPRLTIGQVLMAVVPATVERHILL